MPPADFWNETPCSFVNAMEGATLRQEREYDLLLAQAWHGAKFNALAQTKKGLPALSTFIGKRSKGKRSTLADAMNFFNTMKARGVPIKIYRTPPKSKEPADG